MQSLSAQARHSFQHAYAASACLLHAGGTCESMPDHCIGKLMTTSQSASTSDPGHIRIIYSPQHCMQLNHKWGAKKGGPAREKLHMHVLTQNKGKIRSSSQCMQMTLWLLQPAAGKFPGSSWRLMIIACHQTGSYGHAKKAQGCDTFHIHSTYIYAFQHLHLLPLYPDMAACVSSLQNPLPKPLMKSSPHRVRHNMVRP